MPINKMDTSGEEAAASSPSPESLPPHTSEIGTLKKLPNSGTAWLGSSSGVFFVNTVRRAFSAAFSGVLSGSQPVPATEDILTGEVDAVPEETDLTSEEAEGINSVKRSIVNSMGSLPDRSAAGELVLSFFKGWHPLFPFLHGPAFLKDMEILYTPRPANTVSPPAESPSWIEDSRRRITFQLIVNIASLSNSNIHLPKECQVISTAAVTRAAGFLAVNHDIETIQALLAAELYLVASMSVRQASTVAGLTLKLIYHAGLHRCPLRYAQLSAEDCEIRKRIFWSAYALDRHLSISLGDPNTIQDSDIDVCLSSRELHKPVSKERLFGAAAREVKRHMPSPTSSTRAQSPEDPRAARDTPEGRERENREAAMTAYVRYSRLIGRVIEIFHKSIHARFPKKDDITFLNSDIENWWNDLPGFLSGEDTASSSVNQPRLSPFFRLLYQQLLLLLNRPSLSLEPGSAGFQHGLQVCIKASRGTLSSLKAHRANGQVMLLPGILSANWMAGLIIAFACQLGKYPKARACSDIETCMDLLQSMNSRWFSTRHCRHVLLLFLANIQSRGTTIEGFLQPPRVEESMNIESAQEHLPETAGKRRKLSRPSKANSQTGGTAKEDNKPGMRKPSVEESPQYSGYADQMVPQFHASLNSNSPSEGARVRAGTHEQQLFQIGNLDPSGGNFDQSAYPESGFALPSLPMAGYDPMFWQNLEFNSVDVFNSATWENLTSSNIGQMIGRDGMHP